MNEKEFKAYHQKCETLTNALEDMGQLCANMNLVEQNTKLKG